MACSVGTNQGVVISPSVRPGRRPGSGSHPNRPLRRPARPPSHSARRGDLGRSEHDQIGHRQRRAQVRDRRVVLSQAASAVAVRAVTSDHILLFRGRRVIRLGLLRLCDDRDREPGAGRAAQVMSGRDRECRRANQRELEGVGGGGRCYLVRSRGRGADRQRDDCATRSSQVQPYRLQLQRERQLEGF